MRQGTYIREGDGATLLYYSPFFYIHAAHAFRTTNKHDFSVVVDVDELKKYGSLKPGEFEENDD